MKKIYKILIASIILVLLALGLYVFLSDGSSSGTSNTTPDYILSQSDEQRLQQFVKNFVELYNSYGYNDFKPALNIAGYGTIEFQQQNIERIQDLEGSMPEGFSISTTIDSTSFSYSYPEANTLTAGVKGVATEIRSGTVSEYPITVILELNFINNKFLVSKIEIHKDTNLNKP